MISRRAPAPSVALHQREHQRAETHRDRADAGVVHGARHGGVARLLGRDQRHDDRGRGDRQVEEEDRSPGDVLGEEAADHGPIASATAETPAQVPIAFPRSCAGKALVMIDSVAGNIKAAPMPWIARLPTSAAVGGASPAVAEAPAKKTTPNEEGPAAAEDVAEPAARDQQHGEGERVGVDGPFERRQRRSEVLLNRGQRDVHDRVVEHDHEQRETHRAERPPLAVPSVTARRRVISDRPSSGSSGRSPAGP